MSKEIKVMKEIQQQNPNKLIVEYTKKRISKLDTKYTAWVYGQKSKTKSVALCQFEATQQALSKARGK